MTEDMLPETECPGRAVTVLEVSLETRDRGRGMNSRVSEKPTLLRACGLTTGSDSRAEVDLSSLDVSLSGADNIAAVGSDGEVFGTGNSPLSGRIAGLAGALLPRRF